jgi:hypothetical protein
MREIRAEDLKTPAPCLKITPDAGPPLNGWKTDVIIHCLQSPRPGIRNKSADILLSRGGEGAVEKIETILLSSRESKTPLPRPARKALANVLVELSHKEVGLLDGARPEVRFRRFAAISHGSQPRRLPSPPRLPY